MCLILFAYNYHPGYRLVLAANRDEFLERATAPLGYNFPGEKILGGRDLRGGGSWLVTDAHGRMAAITNYRDPARQLGAPPSRGEIVLQFLRSGQKPSKFLAQFHKIAANYNPFNLLLGDRDELWYFSNVTMDSRQLAPGLYGVSNHLLDTDWPKVRRGKKMLENALAETAVPDREEIFSILANSDQPEDRQLPDTGVGLPWERLLGTMFIHSQSYGTRSSSLLFIDDEGSIEFHEKSFEHQAGGWNITAEVSHVLAGSDAN